MSAAPQDPDAARPVWPFFALVLALSLPFWVLDAAAGGAPDWLPIDLPLSALAAGVPALAALLLAGREAGGVRGFLQASIRTGDRPWIWLSLAAVLFPAALVLTYGARVAMGEALPSPLASPPVVAGLAVMFLAGGLGEELGWQGYAYPRLASRRGAAAAVSVIAVFWIGWHVVPMLQTDRSHGWIAWQLLAMAPLRVITAWIYLRSGRSVLAAAVFHAAGNLGQFLYPVYGSHYDPVSTLVVLSALALVCICAWPRGRSRP